MKKLSTEEFIEKAICKHGWKYNYSLVEYINKNVKVKIICPKHGIFEQIPYNHNRGQGCPICGKIVANYKKTKTTEQFIEESKTIHGDRYDYSLVDYIHCHKKIKIICPEHGVFEQTPNSHLQGNGCTNCFINKISKDTKHFIDISTRIHNTKYDYSLSIYTKKKDKIKIICPEHGVFEQRAENHMYGQGCPNCISFTSISHQEQELQEFLSQYVDIETNNRTLIYPFELDIVIPSKKIAIEYNGLYWHSEQQGKDRNYHLNKYNLCKDKGYRLIQIWENEWIYKQNIVKSILLSSIGIFENKIGARQCDIRNVDIETARQFYDNNHIQGFKGGTHKGLYYNDELISLMTIDKRNELQRFVNRINIQVHGAFSKLLKSFDIKDKIYTFADLRYFTGDVYKKNGFIYQYTTKPNYYYFKKLEVFHRMHFQKKNLSKRIDIYDPNLTEYQNMLNNGYDRIWDCGNMKFIF